MAATEQLLRAIVRANDLKVPYKEAAEALGCSERVVQEYMRWIHKANRDDERAKDRGRDEEAGPSTEALPTSKRRRIVAAKFPRGTGKPMAVSSEDSEELNPNINHGHDPDDDVDWLIEIEIE